jgi:HK97 family phage major capsid protein
MHKYPEGSSMRYGAREGNIMHNRSTDEHIAEARGFTSVTEMRGYFERNGYPGQKRVGEADLHARDLRIAQDLQAQMSAEAPSARSDALSAELATAKTKGERRDAVNRFMASQRTPQEARYVSWLRAREHSYAFEDRAAGEGTGSAGGDLIPPGFNADIIHYMRDYDSLFGAFEVWQSDDFGGPVVRPAYSQFSGAATDTEGTAFTEGPAPLIANQQFGDAPTYAASYRASFQLVDDAGIDLDQWVASALGESLGRALAMPASAAMYSAITAQGVVTDSGGYLQLGTATPVTFTGGATTELAANTISLDTAAQLTEQIDEAYLPDAAFYLTRVQWGGLTGCQDPQPFRLPGEPDRLDVRRCGFDCFGSGIRLPGWRNDPPNRQGVNVPPAFQ